MDSTKRFSDRVDNYVKYRPHYPVAIWQCLQEVYGLTATAVIGDIGSGTGILAELFLKQGNPVYGVEPNKEMREAGESYLSQYPHFTSVNGTAEATTLPDQSVDFVTAGQAFHWFDGEKCKTEFARILRPGGKIALVWNDRNDEESEQMQAYDALIQKYTLRYTEVRQTNSYSELTKFFTNGYTLHQFPNAQTFDLVGVRGRLLSSSYAPLADHPNHEPMMKALDAWFAQYAVNGRLTFTYQTQLFVG